MIKNILPDLIYLTSIHSQKPIKNFNLDEFNLDEKYCFKDPSFFFESIEILKELLLKDYSFFENGIIFPSGTKTRFCKLKIKMNNNSVSDITFSSTTTSIFFEKNNFLFYKFKKLLISPFFNRSFYSLTLDDVNSILSKKDVILSYFDNLSSYRFELNLINNSYFTIKMKCNYSNVIDYSLNILTVIRNRIDNDPLMPSLSIDNIKNFVVLFDEANEDFLISYNEKN